LNPGALRWKIAYVALVAEVARLPATSPGRNSGEFRYRTGGTMPIRFRCVYCNQLLGIARRKAGTVVTCTTCQGQLIVPDPAAAATELAEDGPPSPPAPSDPAAPAAGGLFERDDFDAVLEPFQPRSGAAVASSSPPSSVKRERPSAPSLSPAPPTPSGLVLQRKHLTMATVLIVLGLGMAFALGLWIGLAMH